MQVRKKSWILKGCTVGERLLLYFINITISVWRTVSSFSCQSFENYSSKDTLPNFPNCNNGGCTCRQSRYAIPMLVINARHIILVRFSLIFSAIAIMIIIALILKCLYLLYQSAPAHLPDSSTDLAEVLSFTHSCVGVFIYTG